MNAPTASAASAPVAPGVRALFCIFVVSGVCGLVYESIWSHYLKLFVGHAAYAQTVVLVVFIGGMALGAWLIGRVAERIRSPLAGYALVEAVIGVISLLFHQAFVGATDWAYESLLPAACVPETPCAIQWAFAAALILPQSILLGTTFPLMTSGVLRLAPHDPGHRIALLYFLNSIGAAAGVLLSGFVLIPSLGLPGTLFTAGLLNIGVALAAWAVAKQSAGAPPAVAPRAAADQGDAFRRWLIVVAALTGLSSFVYEIVWIRMLVLVVGASTHSFELMLAAFIFGLAVGGLWVRSRIDGFRDLVRALAIVQVLMGVAAVATLALYDGMFDFMAWVLAVLRRAEPGYLVYNAINHGLALAIMLPATFLAGMTFPLITTALLRGRDGERAIGYTYAANTLGSIVGVVVAVHFALPVLGVKGALVSGAAIDVALGVALLAFGARERAWRPAVAWGAAAVFALAAVALTVPVLPERMASGVYRSGRATLDSDRTIRFHRDGKTASITVMDSPSHVAIATNGKPDASISRDPARPTPDELTMVATGLVPLAYRPEARTAAVIGLGSGMTTTTLLGSPNIERVDTIEIEPRMVEGARLFGDIVAPAFADPRSRIVVDDAKSYFARSTLRYDIVVSEPSNPWVSGVSSLFTQEFYARVKRQLNPGGVFVQWIQTYEFNDRLFASILRALDAEFGDYAVYAANDADYVIVASPFRLAAQPDGRYAQWPRLAALLERVKLATPDELAARRVAGKAMIRPLLAVFGGGLNSDYFPLVDQEAPRARFAEETASGLMRIATARVPVVEMLFGERPRLMSLAGDPVSPPMRLTMTQSAAATVEFLRTGTSAEQVPPLLPREVGLLRAILWNCASVPPRVHFPELALDIAELVNPGLPGEHAVAAWQLLRAAPCARRIDAGDLAWLDLFEAVAARDAAKMALLGQRFAVREGAGPGLRAYAAMAAATGLVAADRHGEARQLLSAVLPSLPPGTARDPAFRLLAQLAQADTVQQAAVLR